MHAEDRGSSAHRHALRFNRHWRGWSLEQPRVWRYGKLVRAVNVAREKSGCVQRLFDIIPINTTTAVQRRCHRPQKENYPAALKDLTEAIRIWPTPALYDERANVHRLLGDEKAAENDEREAAKLRNKST